MRTFFATSIIVIFLFFSGLLLYFYDQIRFEADKLTFYKPRLTTQILDRNGEIVANLFKKEHRFYATYEEIPPRLIEALLAIEDTMFFEHKGINIGAIFRAVFKDIVAGSLVEGASTITQQLVKNTLLTREKKFSRKIKEVLLSLKIDATLTKEQILERYLNQIYFGHGYYGVKTAARGYFHKELYELTLKEIGILVGLPKAPSFYAPTKNYEPALGRANRVLTRMHSLGWIEEAAFVSALQEQPAVFDDSLGQNRAPYVVDEILRRLKPMYSNLRTGGYIIHSTIDLKYQEMARKSLKFAYDKAVARALTSDKNSTKAEDLNGAIVVLENKSADVLALVGGVDYSKSSFNRATQSKRQPGSSIKPLIYQVALDLGYSGASQLADIARTYEYENDGKEKKWKPKNYEKDYKGMITLREALVHSRNLATINLVRGIGLFEVYKELERYGMKKLPYNLSISLGSIGLSPLELSGFYTIFSNYGLVSEPRLIERVENSTSVLQRFSANTKYITSPEQAYLMIDILKDVVKRGTGRGVGIKGIELAGKTGTTNNAVDAWFCGFSPSVETVVWFGHDDNSPMGRIETGGRVAGPAFKQFYKLLLKQAPQIGRKFDRPDGVIESIVNGKKELFTDTSKPPQYQVREKSEMIF